MSTIFGYSSMTISVAVIAAVAIVGLIIAVIAYVKLSHTNKNVKKDKSMIAFAGGIMSETGGATVAVGNGESAVAVAFGDFSTSSISTIAEQIQAFSFVVPYNAKLTNLYADFNAGVLAGANPQTFSATLYVSRTCGVDLSATTLTATASLTDVFANYCIYDRCHSVNVKCGDRVALVLSSGTATIDTAQIFNFSAGVQINAC